MNNVIPEAVFEASEAAYEKSDAKCVYPEIQREIAHMLLKLRVSFKEDGARDDSAYRVDFKLLDAHDGHVILLKGSKNSNEANNSWKGVHGLKVRYLE